jgi:hypothetical protein
MEMVDRENVIYSIERCICHVPDACRDCGYDNETCPKCFEHLLRDALSLLKAQEPRVMALEELDAIYQKEINHVWPFDTPPYMFMTVNPNVRLTEGFWICWRDIMFSLENNSPFYVRENYGKEWMIWTKKPTDEQRAAVKW